MQTHVLFVRVFAIFQILFCLINSDNSWMLKWSCEYIFVVLSIFFLVIPNIYEQIFYISYYLGKLFLDFPISKML